MDPFARKMVYGSFVYGGMMLLMFAVLTVVYLHTRPRCSDRVVMESANPDERWIASLMERRCGAEAPFFTHVNVRPAASDLHRGFFSGTATEGEVFLIEQDAAGTGLTLRWSAPNTLSIRCPYCTSTLMRKHEERWQGVTIKYELPSR